MSPRTRLGVAGGITAVAALIAVTALVLVRSDDPPKLAGATQLAGGGDQPPTTMLGSLDREVLIDELNVSDALLLAPRDQNSFLLLLAGLTSSVMRTTGDGRVLETGLVMASLGAPGPDVTALGVGPDGSMALGAADAAQAPDGREPQVLVEEFLPASTRSFPVPSKIGAITFADDGKVLIGSGTTPKIDAISEDGTPRELLGLAGDTEADVTWEQTDGSIVGLLQLADGRVVFVVNNDEGEHVYVIGDQVVRTVGAAADHAVRGVAPDATNDTSQLSPITTPLAPAPDGRVLTIGLAEDGHAVISAVDVDSGDVEVLADLEGVEPSLEQPVSAVAVGDDLIFLAQDKLWKKEDVFG